MAHKEGVKLHTHVLAGHPVRDIVDLARDLKADLLVVGGVVILPFTSASSAVELTASFISRPVRCW